MKVNAVYCGDCLEVLKGFKDECIDLIYLDPPFFTKKHYEIVWKDGYEIRAFEDAHWYKDGKRQNVINVYVEWMRERLEQCKRVLKDTGSIYLHCDSHANAYLRVMMDELFGENNFRNELIWCYAQGIKASSTKFLSNHDVIFFYTKTQKHTFNPQTKPYTKEQLARFKHRDDFGSFYYDVRRDKYNNKKQVKVYLTKEGTPVGSIWYFSRVQGKEREGYPTQKPKALLERIINASSNKGDTILDPFCGCGTTIASAQKLERQWIGIDVSPTGCKLMVDRLRKKPLGVSIGEDDIIGLPRTLEEIKKMEWFEFQNWACQQVGGRVNPKRGREHGIDGWTFPDSNPIQVKQHNVGEPDVRLFKNDIKDAHKKKGVFIGFDFSSAARDYVAKAKKEGIEIELRTAEDLIK